MADEHTAAVELTLEESGVLVNALVSTAGEEYRKWLLMDNVARLAAASMRNIRIGRLHAKLASANDKLMYGGEAD